MIKWLKRLLIFVVVVLLACGAAVGWQGYRMYDRALEAKSPGQMEEEIRANPEYVPMEELPEKYVDSVVAVEDKRFYRHMGIDLIAIGRAVVNDIRAGAFVEGGSTITQQLAKNLYFTQEKRLSRKAAEIFMAFKLEKNFTKDEILELYVNSIYFGNGYEGVGQASEGYYGKTPMELTEEECLMLAGIPNAPSVYNPADNPGLARKRLEQVRSAVGE